MSNCYFQLGVIKSNFGKGLMIDDIHKYNNTQLESDHSYIQWLFPSIQPSAFNTASKPLTKEEASEFRKNMKVSTGTLAPNLSQRNHTAGSDSPWVCYSLSPTLSRIS